MTDPHPILDRLDTVIIGLADLMAEVGRLRADLDQLTREVADLRLDQTRLMEGEQEIRRRSDAIDHFLEVQSGLVGALSARYMNELLAKAQG